MLPIPIDRPSNFENHLLFFADKHGNLTYDSMVTGFESLGKVDWMTCRAAALEIFRLFSDIAEYIDPTSYAGPMFNWKIKVSRVMEKMHPAATRVWDKEGKFNPAQFRFIIDHLNDEGELTGEAIQTMLDECKERDEKLLAEQGSKCPFTAVSIAAGRAFGNTSWHFMAMLGKLDEALLHQFFTDATPIYEGLKAENKIAEALLVHC